MPKVSKACQVGYLIPVYGHVSSSPHQRGGSVKLPAHVAISDQAGGIAAITQEMSKSSIGYGYILRTGGRKGNANTRNQKYAAK
jgi:hypothetical protein